MDYIYLRAGRVRLRGWGSSPFSFSCHGGCGSGGFKTNLNTKIGGGSSPDYFFSNVRIRQEGGIVQAN